MAARGARTAGRDTGGWQTLIRVAIIMTLGRLRLNVPDARGLPEGALRRIGYYLQYPHVSSG
jgi:hypothetical protein